MPHLKQKSHQKKNRVVELVFPENLLVNLTYSEIVQNSSLINSINHQLGIPVNDLMVNQEYRIIKAKKK